MLYKKLQSNKRLQNKIWFCEFNIIIRCLRYPLGRLSLLEDPLSLGDPEERKQKSNWLITAANSSSLYHSLIEISEYNQPIKKEETPVAQKVKHHKNIIVLYWFAVYNRK